MHAGGIVSLDALSSAQIITAAIGFAGGGTGGEGGGVALAGAGAGVVNVIASTLEAEIRNGSLVTAPTVTLDALDNALIVAAAGAVAASGAGGEGGGVSGQAGASVALFWIMS